MTNKTFKKVEPVAKKGMGLKARFSLAIILLISVIMGLVTWVVHTRVRESLLEQMRVKGLALAQGLANNAAEAMALGDRMALADLVDKASKQEKGILTAALVDPAGNALAHNQYALEGRPYPIPANAERQVQGAGTLLHYVMQGEEVLDFSVPVVLAGKTQSENMELGIAHVVYSLAPIRREVYRTLQQIFLIAAGCLALGILFTLALVSRITRPIAQLAAAAKEIGTGNLDLKLRVKNKDELGQLAMTFNQMTANLKQAQADLLVKERLQHEMELAQNIQNLLVPKQCPKIPHYSVGMLYRGAEEVSGDYFDFIELDANHLGLTIADVSGKGIPGALVMAQTRSVLRSVSRTSLSPAEVLAKTNLELYRDLRDDMFVTVSYAVLDIPKRTATLSRAGHLAAIIYRQATQSCELEMPNGIAIGISDPETFNLMLTEKKVRLNPGDFILLYTDGVDEACNASQELFGSKRLLKTLQGSAHLRANEIVRGLDQAVQSFVGGAPQHDDITMILLKAED